MGRRGLAASPLVVRPAPKLRTRRERQLRENLKKAGIWIFLGLFAVSVLGVAVISVTR